MAEKNTDDSQYQTIITKNVIKNGEIMGIPKRRYFETVIVMLFFVFLLFAISFTSVVRNVTLIVYGIPLVMLFIRGIHNRSVFEHLLASLHFQRNKLILHLVGPEYERQNGIAACAKDSSKSDAERLMEHLKDKLNDFVDKNADI